MSGRSAIDDCLADAAREFGTPAYVYFTEAIRERAARLRTAFGGRFALSYAVKSNPNPALLGWLRGIVDCLDVSSIGELRSALKAGWAAGDASFTGPGKRDFEIQEAVESGIGQLIVESVREAQVADRCAAALGRRQDILVRIAPPQVPRGFGDHMAGRPSAFGIDWEDVHADLPKIVACGNLRIVGLHIYSGTQCLNPDAVCENYMMFIEIFRRVCEDYGIRPQRLVFGSGLGIPHHDGDAALDLQAVAARMNAELDRFVMDPAIRGAQLVLELGRYLVGEAGYFLTRVISIKQSRGAVIAICDGGMNNHLPASGHFGMVIHRNYPMHRVGGGEPVEKVDIVGPLCTSIDRLARGALLPRLEEGDLIAVHSSGAYGLTASPVHFISHAPPREILVEAAGMRDVSRLTGMR